MGAEKLKENHAPIEKSAYTSKRSNDTPEQAFGLWEKHGIHKQYDLIELSYVLRTIILKSLVETLLQVITDSSID